MVGFADVELFNVELLWLKHIYLANNVYLCRKMKENADLFIRNTVDVCK